MLLYDLFEHPELQSDYLSFRAWNEVVRKPLAHAGWAHLFNNKWFFAQSSGALGIATARTLGLMHPTGGVAISGEPLRTQDEFIHWLRKRSVDAFVMKPVSGMASEGVAVVNSTEWTSNGPVFNIEGGSRDDVDGLFSHLSGARATFGIPGYIVQEKLNSCAELTKLGLEFGHSIRVVTGTHDQRDPEILMAVVSVGRAGHHLHRWGSGGLSVQIDPETGVLGAARTLPRFGTTWHSEHPDTGKRFSGASLPGWTEVRKACLRAARAAPGCHVVCWETLLTEAGPRFIEANLPFGISMFQVHTDGFLKSRFGDELRRLRADLPDGSLRWTRRNQTSTSRRLARAARRRVARVLPRVRPSTTSHPPIARRPCR